MINGTLHNIGRFESAEEAARAYDRRLVRELGEIAWVSLNFQENLATYLEEARAEETA